MIIDLFFAVLMAIAIFKGYSKGVIMALLSFASFFVALIAATKLSSVVAGYISAETGSNGKWLPFLSFLLVFIAVAFLIRFVGRLLQKTIETVMLGWANRLSGILLYATIFSIIFSVILYYIEKMQLLPQDILEASFVYPFLRDLGPAVIEGIGKVLPFVKEAFNDLQHFFEKLAEKSTN